MDRILLILLVGNLVLSGCGRQSGARPISSDKVAEKRVVRAPEREREAASGITGQETEEQKPAEKKREATPADKASRLLGELVRPRETGPPLKGLQQRPRKGPSYLENPQVPLEVFKGKAVRFPLKAGRKLVGPRPVPEEPPLSYYRVEPGKPENVRLPEVPLVKWPARDPSEPGPLPLTARPRPDKVLSSDPTQEASLAAALEATPPGRTSPAPFFRANLPDPFEHRQAVRLQNPPPEDPIPVIR